MEELAGGIRKFEFEQIPDNSFCVEELRRSVIASISSTSRMSCANSLVRITLAGAGIAAENANEIRHISPTIRNILQFRDSINVFIQIASKAWVFKIQLIAIGLKAISRIINPVC